MRVSPAQEGVRVQASEVKTFGFAANVGRDDYGVSLGFEKKQRLNVASNTAVRLEWRSADLFGVRAGTNLPPDELSNGAKP
jgi:hypothetical protein